MKFLFGITFMAFLCSCNRDNLKYDKPYFDFDSLVQVQVRKIALGNARLLKNTSLNGKKDSSVLIPDTTHWKHELDAFQQLDIINKPLFKGNYISKDQEDDHSNLLVRSYTSNMKSPVPEVNFFYQDGWKLKRIESVFNESNVLYSTSRKLTLEFEEQQGLAMISRYRVQGFQKMILSDSVKFSIEGKLQYP
jgi:hypothetical protein